MMNLTPLGLYCPFPAALAHRLRAGMANGREKQWRSSSQGLLPINRAAFHDSPFLTFKPPSQNRWEHTGLAWKPGKNKHGGADEGFSLAEGWGWYPNLRFLPSEGNFIPVFRFKKALQLQRSIRAKQKTCPGTRRGAKGRRRGAWPPGSTLSRGVRGIFQSTARSGP